MPSINKQPGYARINRISGLTKKILSALLVITLTVISLSSCGLFDDGTESGSRSESTEAPTSPDISDRASESVTDKESESEQSPTEAPTESETESEPKPTESETQPPESETASETERPGYIHGFKVNIEREKELGVDFITTDEEVITRGAIWLRTEPSLSGEHTKYTAVPAKTVLRRIGYSDGWSRVVFEGEVVCYLSSRYLTLNVPQNDPTGIYYPGHGQYASKIIVIDAGHQNYAMNDTEPNGPGSSVMKFKLSSGTVGVATGVWEHELNLEVALMLRDLLLERGYTVVMIRETGNVTISNAERAQIANKYRADAFIRIHANSVTDNSTVRGALTMCQSSSNKYNGYLYTESNMLSQYVIDEFCSSTGLRNRGVSLTDEMTGINWCAVPATIVEMGFMSNPDEDRMMATAEFKKNAAEGILKGIEKYIQATTVFG